MGQVANGNWTLNLLLSRFGAGSEFGKEAKDEARRKKLGIVTRKYKPDDQPWILKSSGSTVKKFKGIREGGVSENAAYYVFTHASDGAIEAFPLHEWYKFQPIQRYKALSAEEAEQEFTKRDKNLNFFSLMLRKRLKGDEVDEGLEEGEEAKGKKSPTKKAKELKISDMDEWMETSDEESSENEDKEAKAEEDKAEGAKKKKEKKGADQKKKKKPKRDTDLEAFEDSDDGDGEGKEFDYISDSSESDLEPENSKLQGVAEEKALRKLLTSDEGSEDDSDKSEKQMSNDEDDKAAKEQEAGKDETDAKAKEKKLLKKKKLSKKEAGRRKEEPGRAKDKESSSDFSPDSSTDDEGAAKANPRKAAKRDKQRDREDRDKESNSANSSRSASPVVVDGKRKAGHGEGAPPGKKLKLELLIPGLSESGITEESVRRYLMRKPMTTTELLQKCKSKKTGLSSEQLVNIMTQILKKINPVKQTIKGKMYLSIK